MLEMRSCLTARLPSISRSGTSERVAALDRSDKVLVLGAGLQGACAALAAAQRNLSVCLIDQDQGCLERASLRNEGKIHLGHVYAHDPSFRTADLMLRAALSFAPLLDSWCPGQFSWPHLCSNPFLYVVARETLVAPSQLFAHYARIEDRCRELLAEDPSLHYLGGRPTRLWETCDVPALLNPAFAAAAVSTPEASVDTHALQRVLAAALASEPRIELIYGHVVEEVARREHGFTATGRTRGGERWHRDGAYVVNALWTGRLAIDAQLGLQPGRRWVYRLKHRVVGRTPRPLAGLPSITFVLGPFGDVVTRQHDETLYLSWYPVCQTGWSQSLQPPDVWEAAVTGALGAQQQEPIIRDTLAAFNEIIPGLGEAGDAIADGGVIFAWGDSDIDQGDSELHQRHQIGITSEDGYFSMNTGKLTSAPYFARQLVDLLS